ncbi:hypothetical protein Tco_1094333 [Tanacetum coccineum]|uniref:Secreted protein n=1 Tax=Tanacetum coccineum TaxID=301880 RepID=A0ABQ5IFQ4_9ASTR
MVAERWWWCVAVAAATVDGVDGGDEEQRWCGSVGGVEIEIKVVAGMAWGGWWYEGGGDRGGSGGDVWWRWRRGGVRVAMMLMAWR